MRFMISQPMKGLSKEQIEENRAYIVKKLTEEGHTIVDSFIEVPDSENKALWCLGASFQIMSNCDAVYFLKGWENARGCVLEHKACEAYGVKIYLEE